MAATASKARLRSPMPPQVLAEARNAIFRRLHDTGIEGVFTADARPVSAPVIAELFSTSRTVVQRGIAAAQGVADEPTAATS